MKCSLNSTQIGQLYQLAFKRLNAAKTAGGPFDMKQLMKDIYDHRVGKGYGEVDAVTFAQQIPALVEKAAVANPELKAHLRAQKFSLDQLADDVIAIDDSIKRDDAVSFMKKYLGLAENIAIETSDANKALAQDKLTEQPVEKKVKPEVQVPIPSSSDFAGKGPVLDNEFEAVSPSILSDLGQEALSWLEALPGGDPNPNYNKPDPTVAFYYKVKRKILSALFNSNKSDSTKLNIPRQGPVYIKIQSSSTIEKDQLKPTPKRDKYGRPEAEDEAWIKQMEEANKEGVVMMLTDESGYPIRFNEEGDVDYGGKVAYYNIRKPKLDKNGEIIMTSRDNMAADALARQTGVTKAAALATIKQQLEFVNKVREYIAKNPNENHVMGNINGGSLGFTEFSYTKINTPIKSINFGTETFEPYSATSTDPVKGERSGTTYFQVESMGNTSIEIERPVVSSIPGMIEKLISILTDTLVKPNGQVATAGDIQNYFDAYFYTKKQTIQVFNEPDGTRTVRLAGVKLDLKSPLAKEVLNEFFTKLGPQREIEFSDMTAKQKANIINSSDPDYKSKFTLGSVLKQDNPGGKPVYYVIEYPKVNVNNSLINSTFNDVTLEPQADGTVKVKEEPMFYNDFIKENFSIHYALNPENKLLRLNSYFTFAPQDDQMDKIYGKDEVVEKVEKKGIEQKRQEAIDNATTQNSHWSTPLIKDGAAKKTWWNKKDMIDDINSGKYDSQLTPKDNLSNDGPADKSSGSIIDDIWNNPLLKNKNQKSDNKQATLDQMEAAKKWYEGHPLSKHFPFEVLFNAINTANPNGVASWALHGITLFKGSDFTDLYHEAWHGFTQTFLTKAQRASLYNETRGLSGSFIDYKGSRVQFSKASDIQIEEYLAEDFRSYMLSGKMAKETPVKKSIFKKILDFLKTLFGDLTFQEVASNEKANKTIHELYEKMRVGNLAEYNFSAENTSFNSLNKGIEATTKDEVQPFLSYENSTALVDSMDSLISELIDLSNAGLNPQQKIRMAALLDKQRRGAKLEEGEADELKTLQTRQTYRYTSTLVGTKEGRKVCYKYIQRRFAEIHNELERQQAATDNQAVKDVLDNKIKTLAWAVKNFGDADNFAKNQEGKGLIGYHVIKSKFFPTEAKQEMIDEMNEEDQYQKGREGYDKSGNEMALKDLASKEILYLLRSLHKKTKDDKPVENTFGVPELVPFDQVWNRLARLLQNTLKAEEMYDKINADSKTYPAFKQLLLKLGPITANGKNEFDLWTNFWQTFNKTHVPLVQMTVEATTKDAEGNVIANPTYGITIGNATGGYLKIGQRWDSYFKTTRTSPYIKPDKDGYNYLDIPALLKEFPDENRLHGRELDFFHAIGVMLDNTDEIKDELAKGVGGAKWIHLKLQYLNQRGEVLRGIKDIMKKYELSDKLVYGKPDYLSKERQADNNTRYTQLQELQSKYSDEYSNFMVTNAEGNTQFEHTLNNSLTIMVNSINDAPTYQALIKMPHMSYLDVRRNPFVKASTWMNSVFHLTDAKGNLLSPNDPLFGKKRTQGSSPLSPTVKINLSNLSGVAMKENGEFAQGGIASASADEFTKLILDFHLTLDGKPELMRHADKGTSFSVFLSNIFTQGKSRRSYVDTIQFIKAVDTGHDQAVALVLPHISAELERINIMKTLAKDKVQDFDFDYLKRGQEFVTFDRAISEETKRKLYALPVPLMEYINEGSDAALALKEEIRNDLRAYFDSQVEEVSGMMSKVNNFMADTTVLAIQREASQNLKITADIATAKDAAIKSFVYNSWIHNLESLTVIYGDLAQYKTAKEEFHKRNAGVGSTGNIYRTDDNAKRYINNKIGRPLTEQKGGIVRAYDGTFSTAVVADNNIKSHYIEEYKKAIEDDIRSRMKPGKEADNAVAEAIKAYEGMDEGDAQGWISFDAYRILLNAEGKWTPDHEELYQDILNGKKPHHENIAKFFSTQKVQYYGPLETKGLPIMAMHKFSLFPLIPTVIGENSNLAKLHDKMMREGIDYALFKSGSKIGTITKNGVTDPFYTNNKDRILSEDAFTPNKIYLEYLKDQLEIAPEYKGQVVFSTQMRKLIEDGLVEGGVSTDFEPGKSLDARRAAWKKLSETEKRKYKRYNLMRTYEDNIKELTKLKKEELLKEINWKMNSNGKLQGSLDDLMKFVKSELTRQDLSDHEVDFISVDPQTGKLNNDLSLSLSADKIERLLNAIVVKRLVRQKVNGEGLIQVSSAGFENPSETDKSKWGSGDLPTYHKGKSGTNAMKVKIALQGQFMKLLQAKHNDGNPIATRERLNEMLKNEEWLNKNDHRRMITMVGARIPVQGLNSMEFMEVYEFLPTEAGNIIVPPAEIVAKSGSDFDIDKLTVMMPTYQRREGSLGIARGYNRTEAKVLYEEYKKKKIERADEEAISMLGEMDWDIEEMLKLKGDIKPFEEFFNLINTAKGIQNDLIWNIKEILALPENYVKLVRPNGTDIVKGLADELKDDVMEYKPKARVFPGGKDEVSGTRALEIQYNLYKHSSNNIGKQTLGLGAVDNTYNALFNRIGAHMNPTGGISTAEYNKLEAKGSAKITQAERKLMDKYRRQTLLFPHNKLKVGDEDAISLSNLVDANGENVISDVISQLINGWVDIAKDAWIFNIQGNKEIAPSLLFMVQAGVPFKTAVYLVSQPMVREYIRQQKLAKSTFSGPLGKSPGNPMYFRSKALETILSNPQFGFGLSASQTKGFALQKTAYKESVRLSNEVLKGENFNQDELKKRITGKEYDDYDRAAFLHFIEIENMSKAVRDIKMRMNVDTTKSSTLFEAQNRILMIEQLREDGRMPVSMVDDLLDSSPISSFYIQPFQLEIWKDLFTLRDHPVLNKFLIDKFRSNISSDIDSTFGDAEKFANEFRNDLMSYIFQNSLNNFNLDNIKNYQGYNVSEAKPVEAVRSLSIGAFVHNNKMYIDKDTLKRNFLTQEFAKSQVSNKHLTENKTAIVPAMAFSNANEYYNFVLERENIRSLYSFNDAMKNNEFQSFAKVFADTIDQLKEEPQDAYDNRKMATLYEMWLRDKALDNTYNGWKLFESKDSYADQFFRIFDEFPELGEKYSIMKSLTLSSTSKPGRPGYTNLKLADTMLDGDKLNVFHENLLALANSTEEKVPNAEDNARISAFFERFSTVAFLQSGLNTKSSFSLIRMVPQDKYLRLMKAASEQYTKDINPTILEDYYNKFVIENGLANRAKRIRYKNYVSLMSLKASLKKQEGAPSVADVITPYDETTDQFNSTLLGKGVVGQNAATKLMQENPDSYFVYNGATIAQGSDIQEDFIFNSSPMGNKFALPTRKKYTGGDQHYKDVIVDGVATIDPKFKELIDQAIASLVEIKNSGKKMVFHKEGYGQYLLSTDNSGKRIGPESFVYLSTQLFEKLGYVNRNFERTASGKKVIQEPQPINDDLVRDFMKHCFI